MTLDVIQQQYQAAFQLLINNQLASSGAKICCNGVAKSGLQRSSPSSKPSRPKVRASENKAQHVQVVKDDVNS
ncbi:hypothetical protein [Pseudomonas sp. MWU15-20650]|uniref:hypothetical protein n=1 Tax=Pseudomonas sp. MWU15-20650 TaxID=2933107 RepID=UPI00200CB7CF|nr:hypothetical protein [Pseudomonas sp. MWU15-20650]